MNGQLQALAGLLPEERGTGSHWIRGSVGVSGRGGKEGNHKAWRDSGFGVETTAW
jgi:hypothetical protein